VGTSVNNVHEWHKTAATNEWVTCRATSLLVADSWQGDSHSHKTCITCWGSQTFRAKHKSHLGRAASPPLTAENGLARCMY